MDTEEFEQKLELADTETPAEVLDFVWSERFKKIVQAIGNFCKLNAEQTSALCEVVRDSILGIEHEPNAAARRLEQAGIDIETQDKALGLAYEYCVKPALDTLRVASLVDTILNDEAAPEEKTAPATDTNAAEQPLTKATVSLPTTRSYTIDPYKEQV